jgi:hypothetical protein
MADETPVDAPIADVEMEEEEEAAEEDSVPEHADIEPEFEPRKTFLEYVLC